jgi:hypothetical protein
VVFAMIHGYRGRSRPAPDSSLPAASAA